MKLKLILTTALLVLAFTNFGFPQVTATRNIFDFNLLGGGARARGMGGAFFGVSDDPSAASWNPAGLTQLDKYQMGATLYFINPELKYTTTYPGSSFQNTLKQNKSSISFGSVIIPFKAYQKELVASVLYNKASDIYDKRVYNFAGNRRQDDFGVFSVYDSTSKVVDSLRIGDKEETIKGGLDIINLSLGTKVYKDLSMGVGINIYTGSYEYDGRQSVRFSWDPAFDTVIVYRPFVKGSYSGANFTFGAMYKYKDLRMGAVLKTPFKLTEKDDVKYLRDVIINGYRLDIAASDIISPSPIFPVDYKQKWDIPMIIGFGASYQVKALILAGDLEYRNFSKSKLSYPSRWSDPNSPTNSIALNWNSITQIRVGGEYLLHTKYGTVPVRAGFRSDPKVFSDLRDVSIDTVNVDRNSGRDPKDQIKAGTDEITIVGQTYGSKVTGNTISLGTGIGWSQIKLDFTYEHSTYKTKMSGTVLGKAFDINNLEKKDNKFLVNFTGFF